MRRFTMIAVHAAGKTGNTLKGVAGFTLISSDYQTVTMSSPEVAKAITNKTMVVNNLEVSANKAVTSSNGALDRYNVISTETNSIIGTPMAVILDRVEKGGKLVGYTMFTQEGRVREVSLAEAVALCNNKLISNGKIRHTDNGDIVSAIGGNYELREIELSKAPSGTTNVDIMYFEQGVKGEKYFGAIVSCSSAVEMNKLSTMAAKANTELVEKLMKSNESAKRDLGIQRVSANSIFGAFPIEMLDKLTKLESVRFGAATGTILVSCANNTGEKPSVISVNNNFKICKTDKSGNEKEYAKAFGFAQEIIKKYSGTIKFQ